MSSPDQPDESSSTPNLETATPGEDAREEAPLADVDDDVRIDRDAVDSLPHAGDQPAGSPRSEPVDKDGRAAESPPGSDTQTAPPSSRRSLVFSPLILNPTGQMPLPPAAAQSPQEQLQEPDSEGDTTSPQRTDTRPSIMGRRFTYPDSYQEAVWLLDSVGTTREQACLADHAIDAPCARRGLEVEEDDEAGEQVWKRTQLERHYSRSRGASGRGPEMDGAGSEMVASEPEALEGPHPKDMEFPLPNTAALGGQTDMIYATSAGNESVTPKVNDELRKFDDTARPTDNTHQSIMYPARVHLRYDEPRHGGQWGRSYSLDAPRDPSQNTRSENDAEAVEQGFRTRWPRPYFRPVTRKRSTKDEADGSTPEMKRPGTH